MKCDFCQHNCIHAEYDGIWGRDLSVWECINHPHTVKYYTRLTEITYKFVTTITCQYQQQTYRIHFFHALNNQFRIDVDNPPPKKGGIVVMELPFFPDVTPENVLQKLPTYLTFL